MQKKRLTALALGAALLLTGCGGGTAKQVEGQGATPVTAQVSPTADGAVAAFGLALLRDVRTEGENALVSPLSVLLALTMTANGAEGETLGEFEALLAGGGSLAQLNANCAALLKDYQSLGGGTECNIANSLWTDEGFVPDPAFVGRCQDTFSAQVFESDLSDGGITGQVNGWVKEQTREKIDGILSKPLSEEAVLLLVNALYLKNTWLHEFDPLNTNTWEFYPASGAPVQTDFLSNAIRTERYIATERETGVVLPYDDGRLAFVALLPRQGTLTDYLAGLGGGDLPGVVAGAEDTRLLLRLPKFKTEWGEGLNETLKTLGLSRAFDPMGAEFAALGSSDRGDMFFISDVLHKTCIEVNEKGTEAAAATAVIMVCGAAPAVEEHETLVLDRPFVYGIVDLERGVPLFLGTFEAP